MLATTVSSYVSIVHTIPVVNYLLFGLWQTWEFIIVQAIAESCTEFPYFSKLCRDMLTESHSDVHISDFSPQWFLASQLSIFLTRSLPLFLPFLPSHNCQSIKLHPVQLSNGCNTTIISIVTVNTDSFTKSPVLFGNPTRTWFSFSQAVCVVDLGSWDHFTTWSPDGIGFCNWTSTPDEITFQQHESVKVRGKSDKITRRQNWLFILSFFFFRCERTLPKIAFVLF